MNWIFDTYSTVYSTAMMLPGKVAVDAATAKASVPPKRFTLARLIGRH
jgi:hypothetical protein